VRSKRGAYFFLIDVFIAIFIFVITLLLVNSFNLPKNSLGGGQEKLNLLADDIFTLPLSTFDLLIEESVNESYLLDQTITIDQLVYMLYLGGDLLEAESMLTNLTVWFPSNYGCSYYINGTKVFEKNTSAGINETSGSFRLVRRKITALQPDMAKTYPFVISEVFIWR